MPRAEHMTGKAPKRPLITYSGAAVIAVILLICGLLFFIASGANKNTQSSTAIPVGQQYQVVNTQAAPILASDPASASTAEASPTIGDTSIPATAVDIVIATVGRSTALSPAIARSPIGSGYPAGTTGKCVDGTYSSAAHKQGACAKHDGVASWWG